MPIHESTLTIHLEWTFRPGIDTEPYIEVYGQKDSSKLEAAESDQNASTGDNTSSSEKRYALDFETWEEWLGMDVSSTTRVKFTDSEIVAHCLWEMTFYSHSQDQIQKERARLNRLSLMPTQEIIDSGEYIAIIDLKSNNDAE